MIVLLATPAHADPSDDTKDLVEKPVAALVAGDAHAFADTFAATGVAFFPLAGAEGFDQLEIEAAAKRWLATLPVVYEQPMSESDPDHSSLTLLHFSIATK